MTFSTQWAEFLSLFSVASMESLHPQKHPKVSFVIREVVKSEWDQTIFSEVTGFKSSFLDIFITFI